MTTLSSCADLWLERLLSTEPIDRANVEQRLCDLYSAVEMAPPKYCFWHASPLEALWTFGALSETHDRLTASFMKGVRQRSDSLAKLQLVQADVLSRVGVSSWQEALAVVGPWQSRTFRQSAAPILESKIELARITFQMEARGTEGMLLVNDPALNRLKVAEQTVLQHLEYGAARAGADSLRQWMKSTAFGDRGYQDIALAQWIASECSVAAPAILQRFWDVASCAGLWWPFSNAVVLSARPVEIGGDAAQGSLTMTFADGWKAVPYSAPVKFKAKEKAKAAKDDEVLSIELPRESTARIALLRKHAPNLPLYDRYVTGERENVWRELVELGSSVRCDGHAADALAVAYEIMGRVNENVKTLVQRLSAMGYAFQTQAALHDTAMGRMQSTLDQMSSIQTPGNFPGADKMFEQMKGFQGMFAGLMAKMAEKPKSTKVRAHVPPGPGTWKAIRKLEKTAGPLPLSLRAFYAVVGEVDLIGSHPAIAARESNIAPDPLVVYPVEAAFEMFEEEERILIAPDYLHKADTSGGDPYAISVPAPFADALLENEPHSVNFVEYLRIVFAWGGFPGWRQGDAILPKEIGELKDGLLPI